MWYGNNVPGEPPLGGMYTSANDLSIMNLARLDGKSGKSFYEYFFICDRSDEIFR